MVLFNSWLNYYFNKTIYESFYRVPIKRILLNSFEPLRGYIISYLMIVTFVIIGLVETMFK